MRGKSNRKYFALISAAPLNGTEAQTTRGCFWSYEVIVILGSRVFPEKLKFNS